MFIAAISTIVKTWKQPKCPLVGEWMNNILWYIRAVEYYSILKTNATKTEEDMKET